MEQLMSADLFELIMIVIVGLVGWAGYQLGKEDERKEWEKEMK